MYALYVWYVVDSAVLAGNDPQLNAHNEELAHGLALPQ